MKRSGLSPYFTSATLFVLAGASGLLAAENTAPADTAAAQSATRMAELMKRFDKDGDGKLDDAERAEAKETLIREGADPQQLRRMATETRAPEFIRERLLALFDKNGDGRLDEEERAAAQKFAAERGFSNPAEFRDEILRRFDKNNNGRIDPEERAAVQEYVREQFARGPKAAKAKEPEPAPLERIVRAAIAADPDQLRRFDTNHNGTLDEDEWIAARREIVRAFGEAAPRQP